MSKLNGCLTLSTLWANSADNKLVIFFLIFYWKIGFDISCKLSPKEAICMKCQIPFCLLGDSKYEMSNPFFWEK